MPVQQFQPLVNGTEYGWVDIKVLIGGVPIAGIRAVKYGSKQEKENIYGAGSTIVSRGRGRKTYTGSISILGSSLAQLIELAPNGDISDLGRFPVVVSYQPEGAPIQTAILENCEFMGYEYDWKEGDTHKEVELELIVANIKTA